MDFTYYFHAWTEFLRGAEPLVGLPLAAAGLMFVVIGWRVWTLASMLSLGLIGGVVGQLLSGADFFDPLWSIGGATVFGVSGLALKNHSATVVGGVLGGTLVYYVLAQFGVYGPLQIAAAVAGFASAYNRKIKTTCISCPPDEHPPDEWCHWLLEIED